VEEGKENKGEPANRGSSGNHGGGGVHFEEIVTQNLQHADTDVCRVR